MNCPAIEGTLYLKQAYQKNMIAALMMGVILHLAALGTYITLTNPVSLDNAIGQGINKRIGRTIIYPQPPSIDPKLPIGKYGELPGSIPKFGSQFIIGDWDDEEIGMIPTRIEREHAIHQDVGEGDYNRDMDRLGKDIQKELPVRGVFVNYQVFPEPIRLIAPPYPEMARKAGIGATVVISILIDIDGYVLDAVVEKCSAENIGFEEAALQAALKSYWSPAIQSDQAVACWTSYAIMFQLD
jgi:TonB family protein